MFDFIVFINKAFVLIGYNWGIERDVSFMLFFFKITYFIIIIFKKKQVVYQIRIISTQYLKLLGEVSGYDLYYFLTHPLK
jgi:hypothetical protein